MRRILRAVAITIVVFGLLTVGASAFEQKDFRRIDYADGSYAIISVQVEEETRATAEDSKTYTYYNPSGRKCFSYTLYASFTYDGRGSRAEDCYSRASIYLSGWTGDSHDEYTSGDTAYGEAVFSGPDGEERSVELSLTCDEDGNVS